VSEEPIQPEPEEEEAAPETTAASEVETPAASEVETPAASEVETPAASEVETPAASEVETPAASEVEPWRPSPAQVYRYRDVAALADAAARRFLETAKRAVEREDRFIVVLAGGTTPRALYTRLTESPYDRRVPWKKTYFVFGDERCVPPDDEDSNYRMARETLLDPLEIPEAHVLRMKGEQEPADAARRYEVRIGDLFLTRSRRKFDLVLLGIGTDGHTASLFPGTDALEERERWVVANHVPQLDDTRLTLTFKALNAAGRVIFMATGEEKAQVVAEAFGGVEHPEPYPCERVTPFQARREVLIDFEAALRMP
jgi:6-phosphogluconolactonase